LFTKKIGDLEPLDIKIIACCDKDPKLRRLLKKHSTAKSFGDMRDFVNAVLQDPNLKEHLMSPDILFTTAPCQGRSVLREENGIDPKAKYSEDDLFFLQLVLIQLLKPRRVISEMTPPNAHFHADHYSIALEMERLGYEVTVTDRFPSDLCGDIQHRERWIMIGRLRSRRKLRPLRMTDNLPQYWKSHNWYHTTAGSQTGLHKSSLTLSRTRRTRLNQNSIHTVGVPMSRTTRMLNWQCSWNVCRMNFCNKP
jgi:site-specific DNA-cytosine methylase